MTLRDSIYLAAVRQIAEHQASLPRLIRFRWVR